MESQATSFAEDGDKALLSQTFNKWIVQERGILLSRVRDTQSLEKSFSHWIQKYRSMKTSFDREYRRAWLFGSFRLIFGSLSVVFLFFDLQRRKVLSKRFSLTPDFRWLSLFGPVSLNLVSPISTSQFFTIPQI